MDKATKATSMMVLTMPRSRRIRTGVGLVTKPAANYRDKAATLVDRRSVQKQPRDEPLVFLAFSRPISHPAQANVRKQDGRESVDDADVEPPSRGEQEGQEALCEVRHSTTNPQHTAVSGLSYEAKRSETKSGVAM